MALSRPPNVCRKAKIREASTKTMSASVVNVQVQPTDACQGVMKNYATVSTLGHAERK